MVRMRSSHTMIILIRLCIVRDIGRYYAVMIKVIYEPTAQIQIHRKYNAKIGYSNNIQISVTASNTSTHKTNNSRIKSYA